MPHFFVPSLKWHWSHFACAGWHLQEMTHGHLSFIMCRLVAGLVTATRTSCTRFSVSSVFLEDFYCPSTQRWNNVPAEGHGNVLPCLFFKSQPLILMWFFFIQSVRISFNACRIYDFLKKQTIPPSPSEGEVIYDISFCLHTPKRCNPGEEAEEGKI